MGALRIKPPQVEAGDQALGAQLANEMGSGSGGFQHKFIEGWSGEGDTATWKSSKLSPRIRGTLKIQLGESTEAKLPQSAEMNGRRQRT